MVRCPLPRGLWFAVFATIGLIRLPAQTVILGTYTGATITGDIVLAASTTATFTAGTTFTGANATFNSNSGLYWQQVGVLDGKTITLGSGASIYINGTGSTLTLGPTTSITGDLQIYSSGSTGTALTNQGTLTHTGGSSSIYAPTFLNSGSISATGGTLYLGYPNTYNSTNASTGTITASGSNTTVYIRGNFANAGTLTANNSGTLLFDGTNTTANLGNVQLAVGGRARLNGTITNTAATLNAPTGGTFELYGGTISGGTVAANALTFTSYGGYLDGASLTGDLGIPASTSVHFSGGATFTGTAATLGSNAGLYWDQGGTLSGRTFTLGSGAYVYFGGTSSALTLSSSTLNFGTNASVYLNGSGNSLTIAPTATLTGDVQVYSNGSTGSAIINQGTINFTGGNSSIYAPMFTNSGAISATAGTLYLGYPNTYNSSNTSTGTVTASGSGTTVYIRGNFANAGTLTAQNSGVLLFDGSNTTANLGNIQIATSGHARLNGTITNTGATLNAPTGGTFELYGGTITGGTIASNALTLTSNSGYFDGATLTGNLTVPASTSVHFTGGAAFSGSAATVGNNGGLYWDQGGTLSGLTLGLGSGSYLYVGGTGSALAFASSSLSFGSGAYVYLYGGGNTLTIGPGTTVTGDVQIYSNGSTGTTITNQGTINFTGGNSSIYAPTFTNSGPILATAGTLYLGYPNTYNSTNTSTITADGSTTAVYIRGNFANTGTLTAQNSGALIFDGTNTTANLGNIQLATGGHARLNGTLTNTATTLNAPTGGTFELYGGTISGGTIASNALTFTNYGGYIDGTTLTGDLSVPASTSVHFGGAAAFSGTVATLGNNAGLYWDQGGTLSGRTFTLGSGAYLYLGGTSSALTFASSSLNFGSNAYVYLYGNGNSLTFAPSTTVTGDVQIYSNGSTGAAITNQGTINFTGGNSSIYAPTFTNSGSISATAGTLYLGYPYTYNSTNTSTGTVTASGSGTTVYIRGNFANAGSLTAQNSGALMFDGTNSTANLGTVQLTTGGHARLNGTITNAATTLPPPTGGSYELYGGTISGGSIASGALTFTNYGGYLDGATLSDNLTLPTSSFVRFTGGATFSGATATLGANSALYWEQTGTLSGKALTFGSGAYLYVNGTNNTFTLGPTSSVTGEVEIYSSGSTGAAITNQGAITHTGSYGSIYAPTFTNTGSILATAGTLYLGYPYSYDSFNTNPGTITADGSATTIYIRGNFANSGTLAAQNAGTLLFDGTNSSANLGSVQLATGGHARLNGTITNTSATLAAPTGGSYELYGGTITGGTIASGALTFTPYSGNLDGVTFTGNFDLPANSSVRFQNGVTFTGASATFGNSSGLYWQQSGTLTGKSLTLGSGAYVYVSGADHTLTLAPTTNVSGTANIYSDYSTGTAITNQGTILHNTGTASLYAPTFTNSGSITAAAGTLYLGTSSTGATFANEAGAALRVTGGTLFLQLPGTTQLSNQGTIDVQSGTFYTGNHLTNVSGGVISGAGTFYGNVTLAGGTLAPGNNGIGTLTLQNGALAVSASSVFAVEIGGTSADRLVFQSPPSIVNLGTGLLSLSVTLTSPPVDKTSYGLLQISSGGSGISGTFAGLPTSGSLLTANYNGTPYVFSIDYQTNLVSLNFNAVPEPSTYALMALGVLALVGVTRRRRR